MSYKSQTQQFKESLKEFGNFEELFEHLPDILFYVKDEHYKLIMCNQAALRAFGLKEKKDVIGKTEYSFFPKFLADQIHADDITVIQNNESIINRLELIVDNTGLITWVSTNKIPLYTHNGKTAGLMGTTRVIDHTDMSPEPNQRYTEVLEYIKNNFHRSLSVESLAEMTCLSVSQFRHNFTHLLNMSPQNYILKIRIQSASEMLIHSKDDIAAIANACGFCDQSYFTRQFRAKLGISPGQYRKLYARQK